MAPETAPRPPQLQLMELLSGYWKAQTIYVAAHLGLADLLTPGPRTSADLAAATGTDPRSLARLLRALASIGVFAEDDQGRFALTVVGECLRSDRAGSQRALALMMGEEHYRAWGELLYSVRTGKTAFDRLYRMPVFDYLSENPRSAQIFDSAMVGVHGLETQAMLDVYDFGKFRTLVDVGAGNGSVLAAVLHWYSSLKGVLFDLPHVVERARPCIQAAGLAARCDLAPGDFFKEVPPGGDLYFMRHILHDWDDEPSLLILKNCARVMTPGGRLLIVETVIQPGNDPSPAKFLDLTMLVVTGGLERTAPEYTDLLARAGFRLERIVPTSMDVSVIEAALA